MNWNTEKLTTLIQERTAEAEPLFYPTKPAGDYGNLSVEELNLSQKVHTLSSAGAVGEIKRAINALIACLPDVSILDAEQTRGIGNYLEQLETYNTRVENWNERYLSERDMDFNSHNYPLFSLVRESRRNVVGIVIQDNDHDPPLILESDGDYFRGSCWMDNYKQPTNEEILEFVEELDINDLIDTFSELHSSAILRYYNRLLDEETTNDEDATEEEAVPSETQSTVSVSAESGASSPSSGEQEDSATVGDRPNRPWSV